MRESVVDDFLRSVARRFQPGTLKAYTYALDDWQRFLGERADDALSWRARDIELWQEATWERGLSPRTRQLMATGLRALLKWAARHDRLSKPELYLAVDWMKAPRLLPRPIPPRDLKKLLRHVGQWRPEAPLTWWRDRALFLYLLATTARVSEALQLDCDDYLEAPVVIQKGGSEKVLFAGASALRAVQQYVARRRDNHPALWVTCTLSTPLHRLSGAGVLEIWKRMAKAAGVARFTTHQLRHTGATELEDARVPPDVIAAHLGHAGLASLPGYAELRPGRRQEAIEALDKRIREGMQPQRRGRPGIVAIKAGRRRVDLA